MVKELEDTKDETLRRKFKVLIKSFKVLKATGKIRDLAKAYIDRGVLSEKYLNDALHVAVASFYNISYVVSWNFEHLVKVRTRKSVNLVNTLEGYREIEIVSPQEL
jgi:predicted nucleic acid-binding protein